MRQFLICSKILIMMKIRGNCGFIHAIIGLAKKSKHGSLVIMSNALTEWTGYCLYDERCYCRLDLNLPFFLHQRNDGENPRTPRRSSIRLSQTLVFYNINSNLMHPSIMMNFFHSDGLNEAALTGQMLREITVYCSSCCSISLCTNCKSGSGVFA